MDGTRFDAIVRAVASGSTRVLGEGSISAQTCPSSISKTRSPLGSQRIDRMLRLMLSGRFGRG